jgi:hypothetical protein
MQVVHPPDTAAVTRTTRYHRPGTPPRRGQQRVSMTTAAVADSILSAPAPRGAAFAAIRHWWAPTRLATADWRSVLASYPVRYEQRENAGLPPVLFLAGRFRRREFLSPPAGGQLLLTRIPRVSAAAC